VFEWRPVIYKYTELLTRGPRGDRVAMPGDSGLFKRLEDTLDMAQTCIGTPLYMVRRRPSASHLNLRALGFVLCPLEPPERCGPSFM